MLFDTCSDINRITCFVERTAEKGYCSACLIELHSSSAKVAYYLEFQEIFQPRRCLFNTKVSQHQGLPLSKSASILGSPNTEVVLL
jgi:hypothetical protein